MQILEILSNDVKADVVQIESRLNLQQILTIPSLLCGSKIWGIETKSYKKTKNSRAEIRETHSRIQSVRFEVLTASMKMAVFWVVAQCSLVEVDRRFRGAYRLHHQGDERNQCNIPEDYNFHTRRRENHMKPKI
jgi:hypothetical protein